MTRRRWINALMVAGLVGLASLAGLAATNADRPDCPGKIVCPLTGKLVCKDRCPLNATLGAADAAAVKPSCCGKARNGE